ncbi:hypothetical protein K501DRAFT_295707 [Backusella circina FSU 941]|nr:hypothetical protein K501DRAFT_295707 [Backusella circina FSU 941]
MADNQSNNEQRTFTEQEVFELLRQLPVEITSTLENNTQQQHQENFKRYRRDISKYHNEEWTVAEEVNKSLLPKLKHYTVDTTQVVNAYYKGAETSRLHGRAATEIFEQLKTIKSGNISTQEAIELLGEAMESAKRLAVHAWVQGRQYDTDAKEHASKALRVPASIQHLEAKQGSKREAFSEEFLEKYNEANCQNRVLKAALSGTSGERGRGGHQSDATWYGNRGRGYNGRGGAKNYYGGRGRGNPTFHNDYTHNTQHSGTPMYNNNSNSNNNNSTNQQ